MSYVHTCHDKKRYHDKYAQTVNLVLISKKVILGCYSISFLDMVQKSLREGNIREKVLTLLTWYSNPKYVPIIRFIYLN